MSEAAEVPLAKITGFLFEFRQEDEPDPEFVASVEKHGVKVPILIRPHDGAYQGIDGRRRFLTCKKLGKQTIPATVEEMDDQTAFELALIANIQRKSLTPYEEGRAYSEYQKHGWSLRRLAEKVGVSHETIRHRIELFETLQRTGVNIVDSKSSSAIAREVSQIEDPKAARELIEKIKEHDLSYEETKQARKLIQEEKEPVKRAVEKVLEERAMEEDVQKTVEEIIKANKKTKEELEYEADTEWRALGENRLLSAHFLEGVRNKKIFCPNHPASKDSTLVWSCCGTPLEKAVELCEQKIAQGRRARGRKK